MELLRSLRYCVMSRRRHSRQAGQFVSTANVYHRLFVMWTVNSGCGRSYEREGKRHGRQRQMRLAQQGILFICWFRWCVWSALERRNSSQTMCRLGNHLFHGPCLLMTTHQHGDHGCERLCAIRFIDSPFHGHGDVRVTFRRVSNVVNCECFKCQLNGCPLTLEIPPTSIKHSLLRISSSRYIEVWWRQWQASVRAQN